MIYVKIRSLNLNKYNYNRIITYLHVLELVLELEVMLGGVVLHLGRPVGGLAAPRGHRVLGEPEQDRKYIDRKKISISFIVQLTSRRARARAA